MNFRLLPLCTLALALLGVLAPTLTVRAENVTFKIRLEGAKGFGGAKATAKFSTHHCERELQIEVEAGKRLAKTVLVVAIDNLVVSEITLDAEGKGRLSLNSGRGAAVPEVTDASVLKILTSDSKLIFTGKF